MIVVDASVIANVVGDDRRDGVIARDRLARESDLAAPDLVDVETLSVLRRRWMAGDLSDRRFAAAAALLSELPLRRFPAQAMIGRAYELRANVTPYDAMYVALAEQIGWPLLTGDARLAAAPGPRCPIELLVAT